jgi:hypothetical protein
MDEPDVPPPRRPITAEELFLAAISRPPGERAAYLRLVSGEDRSLLEEVESLAAFHDAAGDFLELPPSRTHPRDPFATNSRPPPSVTTHPFGTLGADGAAP